MSEDDAKSNQSVLAELRGLIPRRPLTFVETLRLTERLASRLLTLRHSITAPVPTSVVSELPRVRVRSRSLPVSGASHWEPRHRAWIISLNRDESQGRQRFTLMHEYAHIISHGHSPRLFTGTHVTSPAEQAEWVADYFAGCVLVPQTLLETAWISGLQEIDDLADHFDVPAVTIVTRLAQCGLHRPPDDSATDNIATDTLQEASV